MASNLPPPPPPPPPPPQDGTDRPGDSNIYAFIVGVNEYKEGKLTALRGCDDDVERIVNYLKWRYLSSDPLEEGVEVEIPEDDFSLKRKKAEYQILHPGYGHLKILWLKDKKATRQAIIDEFTDFLGAARSGDKVWFHFSGHGTQVPTTAKFSHIENGMDQCLICYDNSDDGTYTGLIADKEVAQLLKDVAEGSDGAPHILVTLDSCYSGTGTRGDQEIEGDPELGARGVDIELNLEPRQLKDYHGYENEQDYELPPAHVVLTACTNEQLAGDRSTGGVFTQSFIDALEESHGDISYSDLHIHTRVLVEKDRENQTPQFDVIGNTKAYGLFLNGSFNGFPDRYEINFQNGTWVIKAGAIHQLPLETMDPIILDIYASRFTDQRTPIALGMIADVGPQFSTLVVNRTLDTDDQPFYGRFRQLPVPPVNVLLNVGEAAELLKANWSERADYLNIVPFIPGEEEGEAIELELRPLEGEEEKFKLKDIQLNRDVDWIYEKAELGDLQQDLITIVTWKRTRALQNESSELKDQIELKFTVEGRNGDMVTESSDEEIVIEATPNNDLWIQRSDPLDRKFKLMPKITVEGAEQDLYFYLYFMFEDYEIRMYSTEKKFPGAFGTGVVDYAPWKIGVDKGEDEFVYHFKLFVTTSQLDYYRIIQEGIPGERGKGEEFQEVEDGFHKWYVIDRTVRVIRKEEEEQPEPPTPVVRPDPTDRKANMGFNQSHAFVIGVNAYPNLSANLKNAVQDAEDIAMRLKAIQGFDNVMLLADINYAEMMALLNWLKASPRPAAIDFSNVGDSSSNISWLELDLPEGSPPETPVLALTQVKDEEEQIIRLHQLAEKSVTIDKENDSIVFYFAGHGFQGGFEENPTGFIAPSDARNQFLDDNAQVSMDEVYKALVEVGCKHTLLILDCCFAGQFRFASTSRGKGSANLFPMYRKRFERYKTRSAWQVLVSAGPDQLAADSAKLAGVRDNSPFANTLKQALEGGFADVPTQFNRGKVASDGVITATELYLYAFDNVERMADQQGKPQHPGLIRMNEDAGGEFIFFNPQFDYDQLPPDPSRNPYKGLLSYEPEDAPWFFGRDEDIKNLVAKVIDEPVVVVTAPSAYGKSSVIKAGLFPYLRDKHQFEMLVLRPGALPWSGEPVVSDDEENPKVLYYTGLEKLKDDLDPDKKQLIFLDQYEEVFSEVKNEEDYQIFEAELNSLKDQAAATGIENEAGVLRIIIALRSDFEWQLEASSFGHQLWNQALTNQPFLYRLGAMGLNELREALTGPAFVQAYEFEDQLVERILEDVANAPGNLPLLSFTMQEFYKISDEEIRRFTTADYTVQLKGVIGALRTRADHIFDNELNEVQQKMLKNILLRMVQINEGQFTSRKIVLGNSNPFRFDLNELDFSDNANDNLVQEVLEKMEEAHLFIRGQDETGAAYVELAHDALITHWPKYQNWIKQFGKAQLVLQRRLWEAITDWKKASGSILSMSNIDQTSQ